MNNDVQFWVGFFGVCLFIGIFVYGIWWSEVEDILSDTKLDSEESVCDFHLTHNKW